MKKIIALLSFVIFVGISAIPVVAVDSANTVIELEKEKCPKCGKENCDGKCDVTVKKVTDNKERKAAESEKEATTSCCSMKKTECSTEGKTTSASEKEQEKEKKK